MVLFAVFPTHKVVFLPHAQRVTYRYKVLGRVIEKTQVNWNVPWWDRVNNTVLDFKEDDFVLIHHHPNNVMLSVLKPGTPLTTCPPRSVIACTLTLWVSLSLQATLPTPTSGDCRGK